MTTHRSWKLLPLAFLFALGVLALLPGGAARPLPVGAAFANCGTSGNSITVIIRDSSTGDPIEVTGAVVLFNPDTQDGDGTDPVTDSTSASAEDTNTDTGIIGQNNVCNTTAGSVYIITLQSLPAGLFCTIVDGTETVTVPEGANPTVNLVVSGCTTTPTPTATTSVTPTTTATATPTATGTPTGPSQATVSAAPTSLGCSGSSFITAVFRDAAGNPVANGTAVSVSANIGSVNPAQATTNGGSVLVLYSAPATSGGTATITATAGGISGSVNVTVNCSPAQPTAAPAPTQPPASGGTIVPPATGDAGLAGGEAWRLYSGIALIAVSLLGALAVVRRRV
jgi:hypothetical protein